MNYQSNRGVRRKKINVSSGREGMEMTESGGIDSRQGFGLWDQTSHVEANVRGAIVGQRFDREEWQLFV
jgi:hypothetical protein